MRNASLEVFSTKLPAIASRGAYATAWITMSSWPHSRFSRSKAASICPSTVTSSGIVSRDPSEWASGSTDRKSTRLNSSHSQISYAVFCLKKKKYSPNHMSDANTIATETSTNRAAYNSGTLWHGQPVALASDTRLKPPHSTSSDATHSRDY